MAYLDSGDDYAGIIPGTTSNADPASAFPIAGDAGVSTGDGAGRYGFRLNLKGFSMGNVFQRFWSWLNSPFQTPMSPTDIFLLVGVLLVAIVVWNLILYHIRIAAESV